MNKETWKEVRGYEGLYEVSDLGRVRSLGRVCNSKNNSKQEKRRRILTQEITVHGYCRVRLFDANGVAKHWHVHRLVMEAFVESSDLQVHHINEIKTDNRLCNLTYCTAKENCNSGNRNELIRQRTAAARGRAIAQIKDNRLERVFESIAAASRSIGISAQAVRYCCEGKTRTAGGYEWRYYGKQ